MGLEFLLRVRKTSLVSALIVTVVTWIYAGLSPAGAFLAGCGWSLVNIYLLTLFVRILFSDPEKRKLRIAAVLIIKIPALYAVGFLLLKIDAFPVMGLLLGFTWPLFVVVLKAAGRFLLGLDNENGGAAEGKITRGPTNTLATLAVATIPFGIITHATPVFASGEGHELPNFITVIYAFLKGSIIGEFLHTWENLVFSFLVAGFLIVIARLASKKPTLIPGKLQNVVEFVVEELEKFIVGILGPQGRKFVPFLGTLFLYILCMNYLGLVPLMKAPTSSINQTLALALCVFIYVQYTGVRDNGFLGYIDHLAGQPRTLIQYLFVPLMFPLHIVEELVKPVSLSFRLFGNITGEDILIFIFVGLGVGVLSFTHLPIGVPLQVPFYFLALLTGFIQALVFMLLSTIYFAMMLPHGEEEHH